MDDLLDFLLSFLFEGTMEVVESPKVPRVVRILLGVLLAAALLGIIAYLVWRGLNENSALLLVLAAGMLMGCLALLAVKLKKLCRPHG